MDTWTDTVMRSETAIDFKLVDDYCKTVNY